LIQNRRVVLNPAPNVTWSMERPRSAIISSRPR
jgi:hypothetical protein